MKIKNYPRWASPSFIYALMNCGANRKTIRLLVKKVPQMEFFESCARGEITSKEAAELLQIRKESNCWIIRFYDNYLNFSGPLDMEF